MRALCVCIQQVECMVRVHVRHLCASGKSQTNFTTATNRTLLLPRAGECVMCVCAHVLVSVRVRTCVHACLVRVCACGIWRGR